MFEFPEVIRITGAEPTIVETSQGDGFILRPQAVADAITLRSVALILNTPNNPTGAVIPGDDVEEICNICQNKGVLCLSDETYDRFVYGDARHRSLASCVTPRDTHFAIFGSFSKTYAMTGELTLTGHVLAVGGIREKIIASRRAGLKNLIIPHACLGVYQELPQYLKQGMQCLKPRKQ